MEFIFNDFYHNIKIQKNIIILALFNPITTASYADEIICSNLVTAYLESR